MSWLNLRFSLFAVLSVAVVTQSLHASDWPRFRGPNGSGVSPDTAPAPTKWSDTENLKWKLKLPGPGSSSPIVVGKKVFVTCWSGYAMDARNAGGDVKNLKRHLVCLDRADGKVIWDKSVAAVMPEEEYRGMFAENGYASHSPASDGERVFAFYGKTGVFAYDMEGNELWHKSVGTQDDPRSWGTASSPIVYQNLVIVPATIESNSLVALNKSTGDVVWKKEANGFGSTWGTPVEVKTGDKTEIVIGVPGEIWSFEPGDGKLLWYCPFTEEPSMCSSVIANDGVVFAIEGRGGGSVAVKAGGSKDVSSSNVLWTGRDRGRIGTPVLFDNRLYWVTGGLANCIDAKSGEKIYQSRVGTGGGPVAGGPGGDAPRPGPGGGRPPGGGGGGGRGGGAGGQDYASPVAADGKLYYINRAGETFVLPLTKEFKLLSTNRFESDKSGYSATPAISDGELFIRSNTHIYCVSEKK